MEFSNHAKRSRCVDGSIWIHYPMEPPNAKGAFLNRKPIGKWHYSPMDFHPLTNLPKTEIKPVFHFENFNPLKYRRMMYPRIKLITVKYAPINRLSWNGMWMSNRGKIASCEAMATT